MSSSRWDIGLSSHTKGMLSRSRFERALRHSVIPSNSLLFCRIVDACSHQPRIQKKDIKEIQQLPIQLVTEWTDIGEFIRRDHDDRPSNETLWRLSILSENGSNVFWISFAFHHAIGDGTAGLIFHEQLLRALDKSWPCTSILVKPLPPSMEECGLDTTVSWKTLLRFVPDLLWMPAFLRRK